MDIDSSFREYNVRSLVKQSLNDQNSNNTYNKLHEL